MEAPSLFATVAFQDALRLVAEAHKSELEVFERKQNLLVQEIQSLRNGRGFSNDSSEGAVDIIKEINGLAAAPIHGRDSISAPSNGKRLTAFNFAVPAVDHETGTIVSETGESSVMGSSITIQPTGQTERQSSVKFADDDKDADQKSGASDGKPRRLSLVQPVSGKTFKDRMKKAFSETLNGYDDDSKKQKTSKNMDTFLFGDDEGRETGYGRVNIDCVLKHRTFTLAGAALVVLNAIVIGLEVQFDENEQIVTACEDLSCFFTAFFTVELVLKIFNHGFINFLTDDESKAWKAFEVLVVVFSIADTSLYLSGSVKAKSLSSLKAFKLVRVVRVFRVFHFFKPLARLAVMIIDACKSLVWAIMIVILAIYVFGLSIAIFATKWIRDQDVLPTEMQSPDLEPVRLYWGDLTRAIYILFQSILGGVQWHYPADALFSVGPIPTIIFFIYIFFMILAGLNVITGICTDNALRYAERHRNFAVEQELEMRDEYVKQITSFFHAIDEDGGGTVTITELEELLTDPSLAAYFRVLGFDIHDAAKFLKLLDSNGDGEVDLKEFLSGCMRFKGPAQNIDVHMLLAEQKKLLKKINRWISTAVVQTESVNMDLSGALAGFLQPTDMTGTNFFV